MSDIAAAERRLIAALDRIERSLDAGARPPAPAPQDGEIEALRAENARLTDELAALNARREAEVAQMTDVVEAIEARLAAAAPAPAEAAGAEGERV